MKEVKVQIPDDKELVWNEDLEAYTLVDIDEIETAQILKDFEADIQKLYTKYHDRLRGKFSIYADINFIAYHDGNRRKTNHWVEKSCRIEVVKGEKNWHD